MLSIVEQERILRDVINAFYEVYNLLGHGFLEIVYCAALEKELIARGHEVAREVWIDVYYKGEVVARQRVDMLVDGFLIVECKATTRLHESASRQLYNYLKASRLERGLLLHFGPKPHFDRIRCRVVARPE